MYLNDDDFLNVIKMTPLIAVDLLYVHEGHILLGKRLNKPAKDYWFVPGGRIRKLESIGRALERVAKSELGIEIDPNSHRLLGGFEHMYDDCVFGDQTHTHYVCLAFVRFVEDGPITLNLDSQHEDMKWWPMDEAVDSPKVHQYTKNYIKAIAFGSGARF